MNLKTIATAATLIVAAPALALAGHGGGGGGGHGGGGGGGHFGGGMGGGHMSMGGAHFGGPAHFAAGPRFGGREFGRFDGDRGFHRGCGRFFGGIFTSSWVCRIASIRRLRAGSPSTIEGPRSPP